MAEATPENGNPKPVGWFGRLIWRRYKPLRLYSINGRFSIVECQIEEWPILLEVSPGEYHVLRISRSTAQSIVDFVFSVISEGNRNGDQRIPKELNQEIVSNGIEFFPGDDIRIWKFRNTWGMRKKYLGMPRVTLSTEEWILLAKVFSSILENRKHQ